MAISFSRPDPSSPTGVAGATFPSSRRGFDQNEVRDFLRMVSAELSRLQERGLFLERELLNAQQGGSFAPIELNEDNVAELLGEETARIVQVAREAAAKIKMRSEETAIRLLREAADEATRIREDAELEGARRRQDATADAESEILMAKQQGRDMVNEARAYRERVLADVARRRELAREQLEDLLHGRDRLVQSFERARMATDDVLRELEEAADEPTEFVNLSPTTGPIPVIIQIDEMDTREARHPIFSSAAPFVPYDQDQDVVEAHVPRAIDRVEPEVIVKTLSEVPSDVSGGLETTVEPIRQVLPVSNVVSLFSRSDIKTEEELAIAQVTPIVAPVDDIFAKLRLASTEIVAKEVVKTQATKTQATKTQATKTQATKTPTRKKEIVVQDNEPVALTPFQQRDELMVPIIVTMGRKVKRILADEQNEILDILRGKPVVRTLDAIVGPKSDHSQRFTAALEATVTVAAMAGARSLSDASDSELTKVLATQMGAIQEVIISRIVVPLRERLSRSISQADGSNSELSALVRLVYREWKNQHVDEHIDDIVHTAYGRGAFGVLSPGSKTCWLVDPAGPACSDAEDNSLAGPVLAGQAFPTGHTHAPAHAGCRCVLITQ